MIRLATLQVLITSILLSSNNHPIILVHGFLGWGKEEVGDKNYWGGENDIEKYLNDMGYQVYSVSLGPVSSTYDCAIETFYQIKGGQVDYGQEHSEKYKIIRKPEGKVYKGFYINYCRSIGGNRNKVGSIIKIIFTLISHCVWRIRII